jgi:drug/metabolite transporter (DMT)-like permease
MPLTALLAVLLAAVAHATWNLEAKRAAAARHFVLLYSAASIALYTPAVLWILWHERPVFTMIHWLALLATGCLHLCYSLLLQAGYRVSDLSLVYPLARGCGPLLSFFAAVLLLGERITWLSVAGVLLIVSGILLVTGITSKHHTAPRLGILFGLATGMFIAAYTINDGWAVKVLLISPVIVDYSGNLLRALVLSPQAWRDSDRMYLELRTHLRPVLTVALLGPLGYILVLYAMRIAPISHVAPARELATLVGTYFGARLLRERAGPARIAGAACIVTGVLSLAFADFT